MIEKIQLKSLIHFWSRFLGVILICASAKAQTQSKTWERSLIDDNAKISKWIDGMAEGIDLFLAGERFTKKRNETKFTIETSLFYDEAHYFSDATSFNLNLRLPNVEEYWMLTFSSYDESTERRLTQSQFRQTPRQRDYGATLGFFKKLGDIRTSFQPRVSFAGTPKISHSLIFESVAEEASNYRINPKLNFYADASRGVGVLQAFNLNFPLTKKLSLTFINEGDYEDRTHSYGVTHGLSLGQYLSYQTNISYGIYFNFNNQPNYQLLEYILSVSWNHMIYKDILDVEVIPYLKFNRDYGYAGYYGGIFNLRLNF